MIELHKDHGKRKLLGIKVEVVGTGPCFPAAASCNCSLVKSETTSRK